LRRGGRSCRVAALGDDIAHPAAETEVLALGAVAAPTLWRTVLERDPSEAWKKNQPSAPSCHSFGPAPVRARCRRGSAVRTRRTLRRPGPGDRSGACPLRLGSGTPSDRRAAVRQLIALLERAGFITCSDIEDALVAQPALAHEALAETARFRSEAATPAHGAKARAPSRIATRLLPATPSIGSVTGIGSVARGARHY
jgi:hypothetical protein